MRAVVYILFIVCLWLEHLQMVYSSRFSKWNVTQHWHLNPCLCRQWENQKKIVRKNPLMKANPLTAAHPLTARIWMRRSSVRKRPKMKGFNRTLSSTEASRESHPKGAAKRRNQEKKKRKKRRWRRLTSTHHALLFYCERTNNNVFQFHVHLLIFFLWFNVQKEKNKEVVDVPFSRILALNKPEWPYLLVGTLSSLIGGATYPCVAILFAKIIGVGVYLLMHMKRKLLGGSKDSGLALGPDVKILNWSLEGHCWGWSRGETTENPAVLPALSTH